MEFQTGSVHGISLKSSFGIDRNLEREIFPCPPPPLFFYSSAWQRSLELIRTLISFHCNPFLLTRCGSRVKIRRGLLGALRIVVYIGIYLQLEFHLYCPKFGGSMRDFIFFYFLFFFGGGGGASAPKAPSVELRLPLASPHPFEFQYRFFFPVNMVNIKMSG